jgi:lipoprotein-anchoring transpeptidase ErfK/SrfK
LSRILWLEGLEMGWNAGHSCDGNGCDSHARYIYIHGTPDTEPMGEPRSHGCIRMRNRDVMELFEQVSTGTQVWIVED